MENASKHPPSTRGGHGQEKERQSETRQPLSKKKGVPMQKKAFDRTQARDGGHNSGKNGGGFVEGPAPLSGRGPNGM